MSASVPGTQPRGQPISVLVGPRQSGKSSVLERRAEPGRRLVTFDDLAIREEAREDPSRFLNRIGPSAIIDEVQYMPKLSRR